MVKNRKQHSDKKPARQEPEAVTPEPNKIGASTPYDFSAKNLTAYGGLLPVATMLEKLGFQQLVEETLTVGRIPRAMSIYQFVLAMVLAIYVGFSRLNHIRFIQREPMLVGIRVKFQASVAASDTDPTSPVGGGYAQINYYEFKDNRYKGSRYMPERNATF